MPKITKPCPKCGGIGHTYNQQVAEDAVDVWAKCSGCGAETERLEGAYGYEEHHYGVAAMFIAGEFV